METILWASDNGLWSVGFWSVASSGGISDHWVIIRDREFKEPIRTQFLWDTDHDNHSAFVAEMLAEARVKAPRYVKVAAQESYDLVRQCRELCAIQDGPNEEPAQSFSDSLQFGPNIELAFEFVEWKNSATWSNAMPHTTCPDCGAPLMTLFNQLVCDACFFVQDASQFASLYGPSLDECDERDAIAYAATHTMARQRTRRTARQLGIVALMRNPRLYGSQLAYNRLARALRTN